MSTTQQLLIAGGGLGGLAAALATLRAGWEVRLFERAPEFSEVGAGVQLGPNVTRLLCGWGLTRELSAVASFPDRLQVRSAINGAELSVLPLGREAFNRYGAPYATIHRADLHRMLCGAVMKQTGIYINLNRGLRVFQDDGNAVTLTTTTGQHVEGDALLGADGVWSRVRQQLLGDGAPRVTGQVAYRAMLLQSALPLAMRTTQITAWLGPDLHVVQYPVRRGEWMNVVAIVPGKPPADLQNWDHNASAADLHRALGVTCSPLRDLVAVVPEASVNERPWRLWALADRPPVRGAAQMARGRVALLGDAAHPMSPYLVQGAGMAIEDAAELARALSMDAVDVSTRLQRYALARWQRAARMQAHSVRGRKFLHADGLRRLGRDALLRLMGERLLQPDAA
ncbi:MAG: FAD-dependent monooxygenase [Burkholderiaceae bacterium]|nr:FAD-dependent monooxygenase [Burkholderiaceae bacterium]